jgi:SAM-dependent methyltransferase
LADYVTGNADLADWKSEYESVGHAVREAILGLLPDEWSFTGRRALDFGCGCARVLRHFLAEARDCEIYGCDIDRACVEWVEQNLCPPLAGADLVGEAPPLPYADEMFDLAWSTAVFGHLSDNWADWLLELRRVIRPGGVLIASVMGAGLSQTIAAEAWDPARVGMNVHGYGRPWQAGGPMVLHSEWWIRAHWGRAFEVLRYEEGAVAGQDAVVLRRPAGPGAAPDAATLKAPEPGEPRELAAALHSVEQLHREYAELNASHDAYAEAYERESRRTGELRDEVLVLRRRLAQRRRVERALVRLRGLPSRLRARIRPDA